MNKNIQQLVTISNKRQRLIIGLMSGTSLDGLDVALCRVAGSGLDTQLELLQFESVAYNDDLKKEIRTVFAKRTIDFEKLCLLHPWLAKQHALQINQLLNKWGLGSTDIDLIASHGQTVYFAPAKLHRQEKFGNATLQIGDGDHLAVETGIITVSDFRQKHIACGGEGAPLAAYADFLLFSSKNEDRVMLNIGGIANFTYLPASREAKKIICTDVGPGNTIMDAFIQQQYPGSFFDEHGQLASQGRINETLLVALKEDAIFTQSFPKTTGPETFNLRYLEEAIRKTATATLSAADIMATLNKFSADMIVTAIRSCLPQNSKLNIYCNGGGLHNPILIKNITEQLPEVNFHSTASLGIAPDAKEAVLFAVLANECICGDPAVFKGTNADMPAITMGKISFPY